MESKLNRLRNNFTYIDLIVVLSVLALLGVLSLGFRDKIKDFMVNSPREKARRISCASNLKSLGLAIRMYSQEHKEQFPLRFGRSGLEMLRSGGYCENTRMYTCPSTPDCIPDGNDLSSSGVSYAYASVMNESTSVDSGLMIDRDLNHRKYGNVLFCDGHVAGFAGAKWSVGNTGGSSFGW